MNIFALDLDPVTCAQYHVDKHVVKMPTEHRQMMATLYHGHPEAPFGFSLRRKGFINHPCTVWLRSSYSNWKWLYDLTIALEDEWRHRYGHPSTKRHASVVTAQLFEPPAWLPDIGLTQFAQAMPEHIQIRNGCGSVEDSISAYRAYYTLEKTHLANWKNREVPEWYRKSINLICTL